MTILLRINLDIEGNRPEKSLRFSRAVETIKKLSKNDKVVILSHYGRPNGFDSKLSLKKFRRPLEKALGNKIVFIPISQINKASSNIKKSGAGSIFLLDNLRFVNGETKNSVEFSKLLAGLGDKYINDDFATSHRADASTVEIAKFLPSQPGDNLIREIKALKKISRSRKPFVLIIGGVKISDKAGVIKNLISKIDFILLGGGPANTFLKARGADIGQSIFEKEMIGEVRKLSRNKKIIVPEDSVWSNNAILDIGPKTAKNYSAIIQKANTIVWSGPMGLFENPKFAKGTKSIWQAVMHNRQATSVVGGGETLASLKLVYKNHKVNKNICLLTGGGAMLYFLAGKKLPALVALKIQKNNSTSARRDRQRTNPPSRS
ncbi:MAG: phosphoglycerate kinase [Candidatus Colwellbacteria bacterium CG23_combo_of_CG06-09_8_20_14_all_42_19]|uniref:Phosphoglycerate kinase n=1 Tax=Candidatus Colwellbacteria bacterium CG23_combo_of_CG06-09_8_20_14_all_42_19 TaxID=1974541 RepID=A0A2H0AMC0_9BACT|nr:MAG: phosphoglycerate kinase [Candidatus Colwellbacteria bacterium CG23_combo_of_CG06-09_8_20_14_all_42_19]